MVVDNGSSDGSSSYEESDSSDLANDRVWTCDDIYPSKEGKPAVSDDDSSSEKEGEEDSSSSEDSFAAPAKGTQVYADDSDDDSDDDDVPAAKAKSQPPPRRAQLQRHSSGEIEVTLHAQSAALNKAKKEEEERRTQLASAQDKFQARNVLADDVSRHINNEFDALSREYDSSDETMKALEKKILDKSNSGGEAKTCRSAEKAKFEKRNMEREMRLAKARERIEKKKDDEAAKAEQERLKEREGHGKLDMSKAARVERAYSWYSRMAMPTRDKMKERVEFMPASSGVTPDDVDLLPWNARGSFVSVAAMMRMNRTASNSGDSTASGGGSGGGAGSDSDSE